MGKVEPSLTQFTFMFSKKEYKQLSMAHQKQGYFCNSNFKAH